jgi:toxin ParE1/3/4
LRFSPEAEEDLLDIAAYIARDNPERAHSFIDELEAGCVDLLGFPRSGRGRPELAPDLRSKLHGRYVIFYHTGAEIGADRTHPAWCARHSGAVWGKRPRLSAHRRAAPDRPVPLAERTAGR